MIATVIVIALFICAIVALTIVAACAVQHRASAWLDEWTEDGRE